MKNVAISCIIALTACLFFSLGCETKEKKVPKQTPNKSQIELDTLNSQSQTIDSRLKLETDGKTIADHALSYEKYLLINSYYPKSPLFAVQTLIVGDQKIRSRVILPQHEDPLTKDQVAGDEGEFEVYQYADYSIDVIRDISATGERQYLNETDQIIRVDDSHTKRKQIYRRYPNGLIKSEWLDENRLVHGEEFDDKDNSFLDDFLPEIKAQKLAHIDGLTCAVEADGLNTFYSCSQDGRLEHTASLTKNQAGSIETIVFEFYHEGEIIQRSHYFLIKRLT
ncbi:MAG: hypothetical protein ABI579_04090, partial [Candidatus Sumerlaeota bacterium]